MRAKSRCDSRQRTDAPDFNRLCDLQRFASSPVAATFPTNEKKPCPIGQSWYCRFSIKRRAVGREERQLFEIDDILALLCIVWIYPVFLILINSLKA